jgi:hypothetical protein
MDRVLFEAVRQKSLAQWSHRTVARNKSDQLLTGLLFDDAGHRMIPTHATKAGIRYRYYASTPVLHGEAKTAPAGSVSRVPAADIEEAIVKSLEAYLTAQQDGLTFSAVQFRDRAALAQLIGSIVVHSSETRGHSPASRARAEGEGLEVISYAGHRLLIDAAKFLKSLEAVAKRLGCKPKAVAKAARRLGVSLRSDRPKSKAKRKG